MVCGGNQGFNAKGVKEKPQITQISTEEKISDLGFADAPEIGENLCQSVDDNAKVAKDAKDAKVNAKMQRKQRRRGTRRRGGSKERKEKFLCSL